MRTIVVEPRFVDEGMITPTIVEAPGTEYGPCKWECEHNDCHAYHEWANKKCYICKQVIGYERPYYYLQPERYTLAHQKCVTRNEGKRRMSTAVTLIAGTYKKHPPRLPAGDPNDYDAKFVIPPGYRFVMDGPTQPHDNSAIYLASSLRFSTGLLYGPGMQEDTEFVYEADGTLMGVIYQHPERGQATVFAVEKIPEGEE